MEAAHFAGTCYRAANWREVGRTLGYGRICGGAEGQPKRVSLEPLRRAARRQLTARDPHPGWRAWRPQLMLTEERMASLDGHFAQVPDPRRSRGKRYPLAAVLALAGAARLAGCQTLTEISDFGRTLGQDQLRALGCRRRPQPGRLHAPAISTLQHMFKALVAEAAERELAAWAAEQTRPTSRWPPTASICGIPTTGIGARPRRSATSRRSRSCRCVRAKLKCPLFSKAEMSCAVQRQRPSAGGNPAWQLSFQPVAIGAVDGGNNVD